MCVCGRGCACFPCTPLCLCVCLSVCVSMCTARAVPPPLYMAVSRAGALPALPAPLLQLPALSPCPLLVCFVLFFSFFFWQVRSRGCPSHDRGVGQAGPWARFPGRGGAGVRDHFHQPLISLVYIRQQVRRPVGPSVREVSKRQSCLGPLQREWPFFLSSPM